MRMEQSNRYATWEEIAPGAIENNIQHVHNLPSIDVRAIVKANRHGHEALQTAGSTFLGGHGASMKWSISQQ
jgi:alanine racemase